jgi:hypothetical protein
MDMKQMGCRDVNWIIVFDDGQRVAGFGEHGNETASPMKYGIAFDKLRNCQRPKSTLLIVVSAMDVTLLHFWYTAVAPNQNSEKRTAKCL